MTRDDMIRMAKDAGMDVTAPSWGYSEHYHFAGYENKIERFAALVAAAEREACAQVCDDRYMGDCNREDMEARACAAAIRERNNT